MITLGQALRNAIAAERAAERFYWRLAEGATETAAREFLLSMAEEEREHAASLEKMVASLAEGRVPERADAHVELVETAPGWEFHEGLRLDQALAIAIEAENHAVLYYDALAGSCSGETAAFFARMHQTEAQHAQRLAELARGLRQS